MESKNIKHFIVLALIVCLVSYVGLLKLSSDVNAEDLSYEDTTKARLSKMVESFELISPTQVLESKLLAFVSAESGLDYEASQFMIDKCRSKGIDLFLVLGLIQNESKFNVNATGSSGEIGLGQLMEKTAAHYSNILGYSFSREASYEPKRNIDLLVEHLSYLYQTVGDDIHGVLTAYNRGVGGMQAYVSRGASPYGSATMSDYSVRVIEKMEVFRAKFKGID